MVSLKGRQQKAVTASGKPAFHPPGCFPARTMRSWRCRAPCPCCRLFLVVTLQGKHSRECPSYQKWRAASACFGIPAGYCQRRTASHALQAHGPKAADSNPAPQPERKRPYGGCREGVFVLFSFAVLRQSPVLCHSLQAPAPSTTAASARSASGYRSLRPFYSQGRPRWADPSRNRNVP